MKRFGLSVLVIIAVLTLGCCKRAPVSENAKRTESVASTETKHSQNNNNSAQQNKKQTKRLVFQPNVAGAFYPANKEELRSMVESFLSSAKRKKLKGEIWGLIAPHAGYIYSGPVAGWAFKQIEGKSYKRVIVVAFSHRGGMGFSGIATLDADAYHTPLGDVPIDKQTVKELVGRSGGKVKVKAEVFVGEHSLEVELPFLQVALKPGWKLVPLLFAWQDPRNAQSLANLLAPYAKDANTLLVGSTDMSHYFDYNTAKQMDSEAAKVVQSQNVDELWAKFNSRQIEFCGPAVVATFLLINKAIHGETPTVLNLRNSGDTRGNKSRVVGYGAFAFTVKKGIRKAEEVMHQNDYYLTDEEKIYLLKFARKVVEAAVRGEQMPSYDDAPDKLKQLGAAFVTLKKRGNLRGCIGHVIAHVPLLECIKDVGKAAALKDPRFNPVQPEELDDIEIEVSVLTPLKRLDDVSKVEVGRHGLVMRKGFAQGLLLPQVPVEWGWDRETFLKQTCLKAGLHPDCYKDPDTEIFTFEAIVFSESEFGLGPEKRKNPK